ncbi:hypothetical protein DFP72DRAFT_851158 [Ephemerocybe angulata]|uniref:Uncharacterized protein n=1 Tax=Ephemerocybe angulata TaxID=980116 RepID=A0A8H6M4J4_9AGAR|nr:hypothetical protein DFP72DRAFT_851158 [Tulosesus angulatus]
MFKTKEKNALDRSIRLDQLGVGDGHDRDEEDRVLREDTVQDVARVSSLPKDQRRTGRDKLLAATKRMPSRCFLEGRADSLLVEAFAIRIDRRCLSNTRAKGQRQRMAERGPRGERRAWFPPGIESTHVLDVVRPGSVHWEKFTSRLKIHIAKDVGHEREVEELMESIRFHYQREWFIEDDIRDKAWQWLGYHRLDLTAGRVVQFAKNDEGHGIMKGYQPFWARVSLHARIEHPPDMEKRSEDAAFLADGPALDELSLKGQSDKCLEQLIDLVKHDQLNSNTPVQLWGTIRSLTLGMVKFQSSETQSSWHILDDIPPLTSLSLTFPNLLWHSTELLPTRPLPFANLASLTLRCDWPAVWILRNLENCNNLEDLVLDSHQVFRDEDTFHDQAQPTLLPKLRTLHFRHMLSFSCDTHILQRLRMPSLKRIDLEFNAAESEIDSFP